MQPSRISIPANSLIHNALRQTDYADAYAIRIPVPYAMPPEDLVRLFFYCMPVWAKALLGIREMVAKFIGLKTAHGMDVNAQLRDYQGQPGQSIALFHTLERSETEIMTGEDDRHLDFRLSFFGRTQTDEFEIVLATAVQMNGWLGHLYFLPVKPIHRILVKSLLKRMVKRLMDRGKTKKQSRGGSSTPIVPSAPNSY